MPPQSWKQFSTFCELLSFQLLLLAITRTTYSYFICLSVCSRLPHCKMPSKRSLDAAYIGRLPKNNEPTVKRLRLIAPKPVHDIISQPLQQNPQPKPTNSSIRRIVAHETATHSSFSSKGRRIKTRSREVALDN
jgi:hypothetical protein